MANFVKAILAAMVVADCAMTAALCAKVFRDTAEARLDAEVERAMAEMTREKYSEEPVAAERKSVEDDEEREAVEAAKKDPIDEGIENILRFSVNGKTGFEAN